ncbi:MAG TPA: DMT family transporter [Burkholderiaceae bacterium]|nr:DMT family transporter [Burkholderiaceae bacterium]
MTLRLAALAVGVLIVSTAALLIRLAIDAGAGPLAVAAGRLTIAAAVVVPLALARRRGELGGLRSRDWMIAAVAGAFLALHFATWIASLRYTSVASSVALVTTNPVWVGLLSWWLLGEPPTRRTAAGIALAIAGSVLIVASDLGGGSPSPGSAPALGNALALGGAIAISGYFLVGRGLNRRLSLLAYVAIVYGAAAIAMNAIAVAGGQPIWAIPAAAWAPIAAMALGPQLAGHTIINASLRHLSATFVALAILGEPVGSAVLAWAFLGETFGGLQLAGFAALLAGIVVAAGGERRAPAPPAPEAAGG